MPLKRKSLVWGRGPRSICHIAAQRIRLADPPPPPVAPPVLKSTCMTQMIELLRDAHPGQGFIRLLCEHLLSRAMQRRLDPAAFQEILLKYTQVSFQELQAVNQDLSAKVEGMGALFAKEEPAQTGVQRPRKVQWWRRRPSKRLLATGLCALSLILDVRPRLDRVVRLLPVLLLAQV